MSRTRIVRGKYTKVTHKDYNLFSEGNTNINALGKNQFKADNKTILDSKLKSPPIYQPDDSVNVYVGMFFDGTGNNRYNSERIYYPKLLSSNGIIKSEDIPSDFSFTRSSSVKDKKEEVKVKITERDSYWNPYSNIVKLFDLYKEKKSIGKDPERLDNGDHVLLKQYVEGIGTKQDEADDFLGSGMARGSWGVISRVEEGIDKLVNDQFTALNGKKINKIVFDVFGFSRGAAAARHFCNEVKEEAVYSTVLQDEMDIKMRKPRIKYVSTHAGGRLGKKLAAKGYKSVGDTFQIEIRLLGLFDTVVSDMIIKNNLGYKLGFGAILIPELALAPLAQEALETIKTNIDKLNIGFTFHLKAQSEWRKNFPFTPTRSGYTLGLLGAHSDIGGGYAELDKYNSILSFFDVPANDNEILRDMDSYKNFYTSNSFSIHDNTKKEIEFINTYDHYREIYADGKNHNGTVLTRSEVSKDPEYKIPNTTIYDPNLKHRVSEYKISDHYILQDSRYISNKLSLVSMYLMLDKAIDHKVPFTSDYNSATPPVKYPFEYEIPETEEFKVLTEYLEIMKGVSNQQNSDKDGTYNLPAKIYSTICNKFVHLSAHYGGFKNDFIEVKSGDHHLLSKYVFINQPVAPSVVDGKIRYVRETY